MRRPFPFHPVAFGAFPIFALYAHNVEDTALRSIGLPLALSLALAAALWAIGALALRNAKASALFATAWLGLFHSYGHVYVLTGGFNIGHLVLGRARYLLPLWILAALAAAAWLARARRSPRLESLTRSANRFAVILLAFAAVQIAWFHADRVFFHTGKRAVARAVAEADEAAAAAPGLEAPAANAPAPADTGLPDIYYIIPDSYAADSTLQGVFGYDNAPLTGYLKSKGFFIASRSRSNYAFTLLSLASSLSMDELTFLTDSLGRGSLDKTIPNAMIRDSKVMAFLKAKGYTLINAGSWWGPTFQNRKADINLRLNRIDEFALKALGGTLLFPIIEEFTENDLRNKMLFAFDRLSEVPYLVEPTFTLAHFICPHTPFIFGPNGEKLDALARVRSKTDPKSAYLDQVKFMNMKLKETVEKLLARSERPPIIIIQGDHGPAYMHGTMGKSGLLPDDAYLREQMRILNAYYLPGRDSSIMGDSITPVNTFRVILNAYFGAGLPLLENRSYYSVSTRPYDFVDVTDKTRYAAPVLPAVRAMGIR